MRQRGIHDNCTKNEVIRIMVRMKENVKRRDRSMIYQASKSWSEGHDFRELRGKKKGSRNFLKGFGVTMTKTERRERGLSEQILRRLS